MQEHEDDSHGSYDGRLYQQCIAKVHEEQEVTHAKECQARQRATCTTRKQEQYAHCGGCHVQYVEFPQTVPEQQDDVRQHLIGCVHVVVTSHFGHVLC